MGEGERTAKMPKKAYEQELIRLQEELVKMEDWVQAQGNCIAHFLSQVPYEEKPLPEIEIPERQRDEGYVRPPRDVNT